MSEPYDFQKHLDFQSWLSWARFESTLEFDEIVIEAQRRAELCGVTLDDPPELSGEKVMAAKKKAAAKPPIDKRAVGVSPRENEDFDRAVSRTFLSPQVTAALNLQCWSDQFSNNGIRVALVEQIDEVAKGNMARPEAMLLCQAHTLDHLFSQLAQKANNQQHMPNYEGFMRMALKAQNQCRMTLETLANIKNPPVVFAKQANISQGHQQINNNGTGQALAREENKNLQNELLEHTHGERLDTREKSEAIPVNSHLEAVEKSRS